MRKGRIVAALLVLVIGLMGCTRERDQSSTDYRDRANQIIVSISANDWEQVSTYVSPNQGVRFSPYAYVDTEKNVVLSSSVLKKIWNNNEKNNWGDLDGSGLPILLTFQEYVKKFVYDVDFANADIVGNNIIVGSGNSKNNLQEVYPNAKFVEYHFKGFDPEYGGMDWRSLRLVLEKIDGEWCLVGIIHDQWTI